jgi:hypothetical protein
MPTDGLPAHVFSYRQAGVGWLKCPKVGEPTKIDPKASPYTAEINAIGFGRDSPSFFRISITKKIG